MMTDYEILERESKIDEEKIKKQRQEINELLLVLRKFMPLDEDGNGNFEYNKGSESLGELVVKTLEKLDLPTHKSNKTQQG